MSKSTKGGRGGANVKLTFVPLRARVRSSAIRFIRNSIVQSVPNALFRCLPHSLRFIIVCLSGDRRAGLLSIVCDKASRNCGGGPT